MDSAFALIVKLAVGTIGILLVARRFRSLIRRRRCLRADSGGDAYGATGEELRRYRLEIIVVSGFISAILFVLLTILLVELPVPIWAADVAFVLVGVSALVAGIAEAMLS